MALRPFSLSAAIKNMRIKYKLFLLFSLIVVVFGIISFVTLHLSWRFYEQQIYHESAQVLTLTSQGMDEGLRQIELHSLTIAVDSKVQSLLKQLHQTQDSFTRYRTKMELSDRISTLIMAEDLVESAHILGTARNPIPESIDSIRIDHSVKRNMMQEQPDPDEYYRLLFPGEVDDTLVSVRNILEVENLALTELGLLAIRMPMHKMVRKYMQNSPERNAQLLIAKDRDKVYSTDPNLNVEAILEMAGGEQKFGVYELDGVPYFISWTTSDYTNWTYFHVLSYETLFRNLNWVKRVLVISHVAILLILLYIGNRFSNWFVRPVVSLVEKMKQAERGNFQFKRPDPSEVRKDEIGHINFHFHVMMRRIDELIKDNYVKQLLIKESEFRAMQAQIKPHFIYNTLESINMMAQNAKEEKISIMVEALAHLLRSSITRNQTFISIAEELEIVEHYVAVQKIRFGSRLKMDIQCSEEAEQCVIPKFTIQPVVENVIHHALEQVPGLCEVWVRIEIIDKMLRIEVEDNGPGFPDVQLKESDGLGLKNIDDRIKTLYESAECGVKIENLDTGALVTIQMPAKWR